MQGEGWTVLWLLVAVGALGVAAGAGGALAVWSFNTGRVRDYVAACMAQFTDRIDAAERAVRGQQLDNAAFLEAADAVLLSVETKRRRVTSQASVIEQHQQQLANEEPARPMTRDEELAAARERIRQRH